MHLSFPKSLQYCPVHCAHVQRFFSPRLRSLSYYVQFSEMLLSNYAFLPTTPLQGRVFYVASLAAMVAIGCYAKIVCGAMILSLLASKVFLHAYVLSYFPIKVDPPFLSCVIEKVLDVQFPVDLARVLFSYLPYDFQGVLFKTLHHPDSELKEICDLAGSKKHLLVGQFEKVYLWDLGNNRFTSLEGKWVTAITSEQRFLVADTKNRGLIEIWDLSEKAQIAVLRTSDARDFGISCIKAKNGNFIGTSSRIESAVIGQEFIYSLTMWCPSAARPVRTISLNHEFVRDWKIMGNGDLVTVLYPCKLVLWEVSTDALCPAITLWNPESIELFAFLDDRYLLTLKRERVSSNIFHVRKWDFIERRCVGHVIFQDAGSFDYFLPLCTDQGLHFVTANYRLDKITVRAVDGHSPEYSLTREGDGPFQRQLACLQNGSLAACYGDGRLLLWRPGSGEQPKVLQEGGELGKEVTCMKEGNKGELFIGYSDGSVSIWV